MTARPGPLAKRGKACIIDRHKDNGGIGGLLAAYAEAQIERIQFMKIHPLKKMKQKDKKGHARHEKQRPPKRKSAQGKQIASGRSGHVGIKILRGVKTSSGMG